MSDIDKFPSKDDLMLSLAGRASPAGDNLTHLFERAKQQFYPEKRPRQPFEMVYSVTVNEGNKPVSGAKLSWCNAEGISPVRIGHDTTDKKGRVIAVLVPRTPGAAGELSLQVSLKDDKTVSFQRFDAGMSGDQRIVNDGLTITVTPLRRVDDQKRTLPTKKMKQTPVAVAGTPKQLAAVIPHIEKARCLSLKAAFISGRRSTAKLTLPKSVKGHPINRELWKRLKGVRFLFDFSGNRSIQKLHQKQVRGKGLPGTTVFLGGEAMIPHVDAFFQKITASIGATSDMRRR